MKVFSRKASIMLSWWEGRGGRTLAALAKAGREARVALLGALPGALLGAFSKRTSAEIQEEYMMKTAVRAGSHMPFNPSGKVKPRLPRWQRPLARISAIFIFASVFLLALLAFEDYPGLPSQSAPKPHALVQDPHFLTTSNSLTFREKTIPLPEYCDHSCLQVRSNVVLDSKGTIVGECSTESGQRPTAMVLTMLGHINPHHAVHEDYFPLAYQVRNCLAPDTDVYCKSCRRMDLLGGMFGEALKRWVQGTGNENSPVANWMGSSGANTTLTCYKEVQIVLNPLRTLCVEDPAFRYDIWTEPHLMFQGGRGLGMRVYHYEDPSYPFNYSKAPASFRAQAFQVAQSYLKSQHNFEFDPINLLADTKERLSVVIITRGANGIRRRQTNPGAMRDAVIEQYHQAHVSIVDFGGGMSKLDQLATLNAADIVIAVHGAALGNIFAMRSGSLAITQCWRTKCRQWEFDMAPLLGVQLGQVEYSKIFGADDPVVNFMIPEILEQLDLYLGGQQEPSLSSHLE